MPWARNFTSPCFLASVSNTSIKVSPMILRFFSGSLTPFRRLKNSSLASTFISSTPRRVLNISSTILASSVRSRPLSTNTAISCFGTACARSAATTELSTPPLTAQSTLSLPTISFIFAICSFAKLPIFQVLEIPQILLKFFSITAPCSLCATSG